MEKCRALSEYSQFVEIARRYVEEIKDYQEALNLGDMYISEKQREKFADQVIKLLYYGGMM